MSGRKKEGKEHLKQCNNGNKIQHKMPSCLN